VIEGLDGFSLQIFIDIGITTSKVVDAVLSLAMFPINILARHDRETSQ
jgi:hypothetical protein